MVKNQILNRLGDCELNQMIFKNVNSILPLKFYKKLFLLF